MRVATQNPRRAGEHLRGFCHWVRCVRWVYSSMLLGAGQGWNARTAAWGMTSRHARRLSSTPLFPPLFSQRTLRLRVVVRFVRQCVHTLGFPSAYCRTLGQHRNIDGGGSGYQ